MCYPPQNRLLHPKYFQEAQCVKALFRGVQGAYRPKNGEPRVLPIVQSTTYKYDSSVEMGNLFDLKASGYFYSRLQNPTNDTVAGKITMLEGGVAGMLTSSGQAANFYAVFNIAQAGALKYQQYFYHHRYKQWF